MTRSRCIGIKCDFERTVVSV